MPRKPSCECGDCAKCHARIASRMRYQGMSPEERRALVERRDPERVRAADRARYERDKPKRKAAIRAYAQQNPEVGRAARRRWAKRNAEKRKAQGILWEALRAGRIVRQPCEACGVEHPTARVEAHHDDYSKPLDVRWLCSQHHADHHRAMKHA